MTIEYILTPPFSNEGSLRNPPKHHNLLTHRVRDTRSVLYNTYALTSSSGVTAWQSSREAAKGNGRCDCGSAVLSAGRILHWSC